MNTESRTVRAVVFDMDETLTYGKDTVTGEEIDLHCRSWQSILAQHGCELSEQDYVSNMRGGTNIACEAWLEGRFDIRKDIGIADAKEQRYRDELVGRYLEFREGVVDCLRELRGSGLRIGLLTNAPRANVVAANLKLDLWKFIERELALDVDDLAEIGLRSKPEPDGLLELARRLNLRCEQLVYIGDSKGDMQTARAADVPAIGFVAGNTERTLRENGAYCCISHFGELTDRLL